MIRRIRVRYRLAAPEEKRETVARVHAMHADHCPVARSIRGSIEVSTSFELIPD